MTGPCTSSRASARTHPTSSPSTTRTASVRSRSRTGLQRISPDGHRRHRIRDRRRGVARLDGEAPLPGTPLPLDDLRSLLRAARRRIEAHRAVRSILVMPQYSTEHACRLLAHIQVTTAEQDVTIVGGDDMRQSLGSSCAAPRARRHLSVDGATQSPSRRVRSGERADAATTAERRREEHREQPEQRAAGAG